MILIDLIHNLSILVSISVLTGYINSKLKLSRYLNNIALGFFFGITAIVGMLDPVIFTGGIIFDGRSVLISICTLFFGPVSGIIAALVSAAYRFYLGGPGTIMGLLVILFSFLIGWVFYNNRKNKPYSAFTFGYFYKFGLIVHAVMLMLILTLPSQYIVSTYKQLSISIIGVFPFVTVLIGTILNSFRQNKTFVKKVLLREKLFRTLFELSPAGILLEDTKGNIIDFNEAYRTITGYERKELIGKNIRLIVPPENISEIDAHLQLLLNGETLNHDVAAIRKDGARRQIRLNESLIALPDDTAGIIVVANDVTDRNLIESALSSAEQKLRELLENTTNLFYSHTTEGILTYISPQSKEFLGYEPHECMIHWKNFVTDNPLNQNGVESTARAIQTGKVQLAYEIELKKKSGNTMWVEVHEAPVVKDGKTISIVGTLTDITKRKQAEEKIRRSELQYRTLYESANDPIIIFEPESEVILEVNNKACEVYGFSKDEFIGMSLKQISKNVEAGQVRIRKTLNTGSYKNFETIHSTKDGNTLNILVNASVIDYEGETAILSINRDITDRKITEELLISSEKKYRHLFENNPLPMWIYDLNTLAFLEVNEAALIHYGYSKNEFLQMSIKEIRPSEDVDALLETIQSKKELNYSGIWRHKKKTGEIILVEIISHLISYDNQPARLVLANDVTEKNAALERANILNRAIEQSPVSIVITDPAGKIEYINPQFTKLTGYTLEEVKGKNPRLLKSGETSSEDYKELWNAIRAGIEWHGELHNKKKNGDLFWANTVISPLFDKQGKIVHLIGVEEDVTEKKKMIDELIKAKEKAEEMNKIKNNFLSNMSHELRTPLIGILGYTEMMLSEFTNAEHREMAEVVHSSSKRLHQTLNLILDLSNIESSKTEVRLQPVDVDNLLNRIYVLFYKAIDSSKVDFQLINVVPGLTIASDERLLENIINNLLNNAAKFTEKGSIILKAEKCELNKTECLKISVIDSGIGISLEKQEQIYSEFRQVSEGPSRRFEGIGLGLTVAKKFTELIGGKIFVKSQLGAGSDFSFIIPLDLSDINYVSSKINSNPVSKHELSLNKLNIILVDDDPVLIDIVRRFLKNVAQIDSAQDGLSAIKKISSKEYNLILLDIGLGGNMDGVEVLQRLRRLPGYYHVPVIACTAFAMRSEREKFLSAGFSDYLAKPFTRQQLSDIISKNLESLSA